MSMHQINETKIIDFEGDAALPLLDAGRQNQSRTSWRGPALLMGLLIGVAVQLATVGITTLTITIFGADVLQQTHFSLVGLPIIYNAVTLSFIWSTLAILRIVLQSANRIGRQSNEDDEESEDDKHFKANLAQFEGHFVLGAVFGAGFLWLVVDLLMGTNSKMFFALLPLNVILSVYILLGLVADLSKEVSEDDEEDECQIRSTGGSRYRNGPYDV
ncbi:hypothetical protein FisN_20Lh272 [Fistulifera solaris]|uniref:Uncharacterized protein n=1 Tax=Fistulifera solaris TaxID=1519565 RepID=A0A1Z5KSP1_FISSO|nr:hypothetical protein FisN_20Lh272 [Fistulifera solaris]|eukprot:GAX28948.1 hypothetical protein FisN_20Lh272 [Fistulifera solaris]